uniref:Inhibitor of nuclear factor kappa-B kinase-interacting protein n=1 Tax=Pogona vitticeps TaxID=103695 RepID=A0A6J0UFQ4_9SAUR
MPEVKRRRTANLSARTNEDQDKEQSGFVSKKSMWMDPPTASGLLALITCAVLTWFLFQQSTHLAVVEEKYNLLKQEAVKCQAMENKITIMSEKFESSSDILKETASSVSVMTTFEQEISSLRNIISNIQNGEQTYSKNVQTISEKFQGVIESWKRSQAAIATNTSSLNLEAKLLHSEIASQINAADQKLKSLSERLKDLEESTVRNLKTLNRQEEEELNKVEEQLQFDRQAAGKLEEQQNDLLARNRDLSQKLADYEPKMEECKTHLPAIENAIHSVLRVSSELVAMEKKMEDMNIKVFHIEEEVKKTISDVMNIQKTLQGMEYENTTIKQNSGALESKEKNHDFAQSAVEAIEENNHRENV